MRKCPSVAIVIATFNAASTVTAAIRSVLDQDYPNLELLVIDGASTDSTVELVTSFKDERIRIVSEPDKGIYDAWNKGVQMSSADRILFIGADDTLNGTSAISDFWSRCNLDLTDCGIVYADLIALGVDGVQMGKVGGEWKDPWSFSGRHAWCSFPIPIMASFFDRELILAAGGFDADLRIMADIDLVLRVAKLTRPKYLPGRAVTRMGFGGISTRPEAGAMAMREAVLVRRKHELGTFSNLEFLARLAQHRTKYLIAKHLGLEASRKMVGLLHRLKKGVCTVKTRHL